MSVTASEQRPSGSKLRRRLAFWRRATRASPADVPSVATPLGPFVFRITADPDTSNPAGGVPAEQFRVPLATERRFRASDVEAVTHHARGTVRFTSHAPDRQLNIPRGTIVTTGAGVAFRTTDGVILARQGVRHPASTGEVPVEAALPGPAGNVRAHAIEVVPAALKAASVDNPSPTGGGEQAEIRRVSLTDYEAAIAAATERLAEDLDRAAAALDPTHHALAATARFQWSVAEPAATDVVGRRADWVDLRVETTATITAVPIRDLEAAAAAHVEAMCPAGGQIVPGSIAGRVVGAAVEGGSVTYTISATAWLTFDADAEVRPPDPVPEPIGEVPPSSPGFVGFDLFAQPLLVSPDRPPARRYLWTLFAVAIALALLGVYQFANRSDILVVLAICALAAGAIAFLAVRTRPRRRMRLGLPRRDDRDPRAPASPTATAQTARAARPLAPTNGTEAASPVSTVGFLNACPYLGLPDDPETHFMFAAPGHRCYAGPRPERIGLPHQGSFCLSGEFRECPRFPAADRSEDAAQLRKPGSTSSPGRA